MTLHTTTTRIDYVGNDVAVDFPFPFQINSLDHVVVTLFADGEDPEVLDLGVDYDIPQTAIYAPNGGVVTLTGGPLEAGSRIEIKREVPLTQGTDLKNQGRFFPETHERAFDKRVMQIQQVNQRVDDVVEYLGDIEDLINGAVDGIQDAVDRIQQDIEVAITMPWRPVHDAVLLYRAVKYVMVPKFDQWVIVSGVAPAANAELRVFRNDTLIAIATMPAGQKEGTITGIDGTELDAGDVLVVRAPEVRDVEWKEIGFSLIFGRIDPEPADPDWDPLHGWGNLPGWDGAIPQRAAEWRFNEPPGPLALDRSGNNRNLQYGLDAVEQAAWFQLPGARDPDSSVGVGTAIDWEEGMPWPPQTLIDDSVALGASDFFTLELVGQASGYWGSSNSSQSWSMKQAGVEGGAGVLLVWDTAGYSRAEVTGPDSQSLPLTDLLSRRQNPVVSVVHLVVGPGGMDVYVNGEAQGSLSADLHEMLSNPVLHANLGSSQLLGEGFLWDNVAVTRSIMTPSQVAARAAFWGV